MIALVDGLPKTMTLKDFLNEFIAFREEVVTRRALFNKAKASKRLHLVEGYLIGIDNLDGVLAIVKNSKSNESALTELQNSFTLSQEQAEGLLSMTLRRFTSFEKEKLISEKEDLQQQCVFCERFVNKDKTLPFTTASSIYLFVMTTSIAGSLTLRRYLVARKRYMRLFCEREWKSLKSMVQKGKLK